MHHRKVTDCICEVSEKTDECNYFINKLKAKKTMKELAVKNYKTAEGQKISQGGNEFTVSRRMWTNAV